MKAVCALVTALLIALVASGCGSEEPRADATPDPVVEACRAQWKSLNAQWEARAQSTFPSDLAERWTALAAGGAYQSAAAGDDCEEQIRLAQGDARAIERLSNSLRVYDLVWQYGDINATATSWIKEARATPGKRPAARKAHRSLKVLQAQAAQAAVDMAAAWHAAVQTDLRDPIAMRKFADSMEFVASDSAPYRAGNAALTRIKRLISRR